MANGIKFGKQAFGPQPTIFTQPGALTVPPSAAPRIEQAKAIQTGAPLELAPVGPSFEIPQTPTSIPNIPSTGGGFGQATVTGAAIGSAVPGIGTAVGAGAGLALDVISFGVNQYFSSKAEAKQLREVRRVQAAQQRQNEIKAKEGRRRFDVGTAFNRETFEFKKEQADEQNKIAQFQRLKQVALNEVFSRPQFKELFSQRGIV